jgi:hypothetical protein
LWLWDEIDAVHSLGWGSDRLPYEIPTLKRYDLEACVMSCWQGLLGCKLRARPRRRGSMRRGAPIDPLVG